MERQTLKVVEAARLLGIGKASAYAGIKAGEIPSIRIGRRILVPVASLVQLLEKSVPSQADSDK